MMQKRRYQTYARRRRAAKRRQAGLGCAVPLLLAVALCLGVAVFTGVGQALAGRVAAFGWFDNRAAQQTVGPATSPPPTATALPAAQTPQEVLVALEASTAFLADGIPRYAYQALTDAEKITYILIAQCVLDMASEVELPPQANKAIADIWPLIRADFPEVFWVESSLSRTITEGESTRVLFVPKYNRTPAQRATQQAEVEAVANRYFQSLAADASTYQKVQAAYEFVVGQVEYQKTPNDQTVYGALAQGQAVCAGYSRAVQYLLNRVGVVCGYVSGEAASKGERFTHAWNFVQIEEDYYFLDTTWGEDNSGTGVDYGYLCVNATDLATTHFADAIYQLPAVEGVDYNYYRVQGAYFDAYDYDAILAALLPQQQQGYYTMRFATEQGAQQAIAALVQEKEIYAILREMGQPTKKLGYTYKETLHILTIYPHT